MRHLLMIAATLTLTALPHARQQPVPADIPLPQLIARAAYWTTRFEGSLSGLLFREHYRQSAHRRNTAFQMGAESLILPPAVVTAGRLLEANVFMLRPPGALDFIVYRDVYRVNQREIADHTERLQKLLADGSASAIAQARRLTDESARYNLAGVRRNINVPTLPFEYLAPERASRLQVREAGRDTIEGLAVVIVEFKETAPQTLVRGRRDADVPATGRFWIHPESGAVPRALVQFSTRHEEGRMEVRLTLHETLQLWVPKEMIEVWRGTGPPMTGFAQYDRFQRLAVSTSEIIK